MKNRVVPDGYFITFIVLSLFLHFTFPIEVIIHYPYSLTGIVLIIAGLLAVFVTNSFLLRKRTSIKPFETPSALVTSGPFRFSRNPIYLGMAIILLGLVTVLGSLSPFVFPIVFIVIMDRLFIRSEESDLERIFGQEYLDYKKGVRRWI